MKYTKKDYPRLYNSWRGMKGRCNNPKQIDYKYYGAKGIKVYPEWNSFKNFAMWALDSGYKEGLTIDRIDSTKDYNPNNCRWVSHAENVIRANKNRYKQRFEDAYKYWLNINGDITGTELGSIFGISFSQGCKWIRIFKRRTNE